MTCNLPRDFQVFWPKILWPQASSSCFPRAHCSQWRMAPKALAMWWKEKARSIPSVAPGVTWKAKKELWCHSFGSSQPLKKPWLIWWPPLPRVKMAHGPFHVLRIPPRLKQESSYCITSPRMRTILWSCLPPGRSRRPADFFAGMWIKFPIAIFHLNQPLKQGPLEGKMWMCSCEFESLKSISSWCCMILPAWAFNATCDMLDNKSWNETAQSLKSNASILWDFSFKTWAPSACI